MKKFTLAFAAAALGAAAMAAPAQADEQFFPLLVYRTGPYAPNGIPFADGVAGLPDAAQRARRRHQRRQDHHRGMRDRLRHRQGRRVLRAPEGPRPDRRDLRLAALDRHHLRADREGAGRQGPAADDGLRPLRQQGRLGVPVELHRGRLVLDRRRRRHPAHRPRDGRHGQAQGQEDQPRLSRQPVRQGADRGDRGARQEGRLHLQGDPGHASGRRAEVAVAVDPPGPARLRAAVGLGRDELDRHQGSRGGRLSARQDDRRVVVGRRARRDAGRRPVEGLQGADAPAPAPASSRCTTICRSSCSPRASRCPRTTTRRCSTTAACSTR